MPVEFLGGALSFKGDKPKKKKKKQKTKHELNNSSSSSKSHTDGNATTKHPPPIDDTIATTNDNDADASYYLTEVERKALERKKERERIDAERIAQMSHRERVEEFNQKLASLTELNDIPRVSAAGNG